MVYIPWTLYAMRLRRVAQRLADANSIEDVALCLQEHSALWDRISGLIDEAEEQGETGLSRQISPLTRLVAVCGTSKDAVPAADVSSDMLSTLISLNQRAAAMLPDLDRGMPMRQWLN